MEKDIITAIEELSLELEEGKITEKEYDAKVKDLIKVTEVPVISELELIK